MSDALIAQFVICSLLILEGFVLAWWYRRSVVRPARLEAAQYKFFALRDKAIRLAIDSRELRDDQLWKNNYQLLNDLAKSRTVDLLMGTSVLRVISSFEHSGVPIKFEFTNQPSADLKPIKLEDLPPLHALAIKSFITMLETCYQMTRWLRLKYWLANRIGRIQKILIRQSSGYAAWHRLFSAVAPQIAPMKIVSGNFGDLIDREASRQRRHATCGEV